MPIKLWTLVKNDRNEDIIFILCIYKVFFDKKSVNSERDNPNDFAIIYTKV